MRCRWVEECQLLSGHYLAPRKRCIRHLERSLQLVRRLHHRSHLLCPVSLLRHHRHGSVVQRLRLQIQKSTLSLIQVSFTFSAFNKHMFGGVLLETCLFIFFLYVPGVNGVFGGRYLCLYVDPYRSSCLAFQEWPSPSPSSAGRKPGSSSSTWTATTENPTGGNATSFGDPSHHL